MSVTTYNTLTMVLLFGAVGALGLSLTFLATAAIRWRSPYRRRLLIAFACSLLAVPALVGIQQAILWNVFLPSFGEEIKQQRKARTEASSIIHVGYPAPEFAVTDTKGVKFELQKYRGKVVLVNFFATWCGPCIAELPHIQKIWDKYRTHSHFGLIVLGRQETQDKVAEFQAAHEFTFQMAADPDMSIYSRYASNFIPRTYLIGADGKVCFEVTGFKMSELQKLEQELGKQLSSLH